MQQHGGLGRRTCRDEGQLRAALRAQLLPREIRVPIPFPRLTFIDGEGRTPNWGVRVALIPVKFHDNLLTGDDIAGEKFTYVAVK